MSGKQFTSKYTYKDYEKEMKEKEEAKKSKEEKLDDAHRFEVPKKKLKETYAQREERVSAYNYNFLKDVEERAKTYHKKTHQKPPIYKDSEGKLFWPNRKDLRKMNNAKHKKKNKSLRF